MQNKNTEQIVIVRNPNSTGAALVDKQVINPLNEQGVSFDEYHTEFADTERNIDAMQQDIPTGAKVIIAAGDGTLMQMMNASLRGDKDWTIGATRHGNFSDHATTHADRHHTALNLVDPETPIIDVTPLTIEVNGKYWRHAPSYLTIGWSAIAAAQFGDQESREAMKGTPKALKLARSMGQLLGNYHQNGKTFLPPFTVNDILQDRKTDIMAVNGPRVAGVIRSQDTYYDKPYFGMKADVDVSRIPHNIPFGLKALAGHTPLDRANKLHIVFEKAARIPVQSEGEFQWLDAEEIFIYKNPSDAVKVLHPKSVKKRQ